MQQMQHTSNIALWAKTEEDPTAWKLTWVEATIWTDCMVSALGNGVKGGLKASFARLGLFTQNTAPERARHSRWGNQRLESRMRENRTYGSEGGEAKASPPPIPRLSYLCPSAHSP